MKRIVSLPLVVLAACAIATMLAACGDRDDGGAVADKAKALAALQDKRTAYEAKLKKMNITELTAQLASDSAKGREPFNSTAYREIVARGPAATSDLKTAAMRRDRSSLLALLALRTVDPGSYATLDQAARVDTLVDALKNAQFFNAWGIPHLYWEEAAKALIAEGTAAERPLIALLGDRRPAPVFGSEGAALNREYGYRVCDYAWALLDAARGRKIDIPADPAARDRLIEVDIAAP
jgi:hypothetical protein